MYWVTLTMPGAPAEPAYLGDPSKRGTPPPPPPPKDCPGNPHLFVEFPPVPPPPNVIPQKVEPNPAAPGFPVVVLKKQVVEVDAAPPPPPGKPVAEHPGFPVFAATLGGVQALVPPPEGEVPMFPTPPTPPAAVIDPGEL